MPVPDIFRQGMRRGWQVYDGSQPLPALPRFDVIIIGSGAGGGTAAEILALAGLRIAIIEEGSLKTSSDFHNDEIKAYTEMYQEGALRTTKDGSISILQGRTVGGTTTVNWTSSFRTPASTLAVWENDFGIDYANTQAMTPWFEQIEQRLNVQRWGMAPNANNDVIRLGCEQLGWGWDIIPRNVTGCWNLGYCGTGCPVNAKQSMLVTTLPTALENHAVLIHSMRAEKLEIRGDKVEGVHVRGMNASLTLSDGARSLLLADHVICAGGSINTPALLLRSRAPDPYQLLGSRTFLHPVCMTAAQFERAIDGFYGAPQSVYSDHFNETPANQERLGYKLEVPPMQPSVVAALLGSWGNENWLRMQQLGQTNIMLALMRDGFLPDCAGGQVELRSNGDATLDYPFHLAMWRTVREALWHMGQIQFAAGATKVMPLHTSADYVSSPQALAKLLDQLAYEPLRVRLSSAHVMGGCRMGSDPKNSVTRPDGRHQQLQNCWVFDGSIFPTSVGANPQLSIYAFVAKLATDLSRQLA
ncbi:GMC family oxidoreductase N-terminal domain-containing protein [Aliidiomarina haloalkalitolerans]|uniref:GMC family oxidoreductase n=1 Tax=Aliidiomarina haloalkalitolerans TaxID=859059 RepID=A0A432VVT2_9GAMM|nr:GMC family oxidoreductase [Aliidiomarina haloalkalitolerans]RUO20710.1 GMC family oxidoreductase [Aliidiomarina haloalkalitolerans]